MQPDSLDRDFRTFRQTRDPKALAAVFDVAAPRLLLVAMHLCRDAATAEDLVQTVFLQVLRDVERFDPRRPVLPWLLGMLEHRASDLRRSAHVRREHAADGEVLAKNASPERAAAANEVRERVAEALAGMPGDYRDVLALRLVHGLSAVDIAHAHGVPPATVRSRLRRGLELLRSALPRGLATHGVLAVVAAELLTARDGMSAVRAKVLAAAGAGVGATFALGWLLAAAAALLLAIGGWFVFAPAAEAEPHRIPEVAPVVAANVPDGGETARDAENGQNARQVAAQRTAVADPRITTIRGRVIDARGVPLPGAAVRTNTYPASAGRDDPDWRDPAPVTGAADGTFAMSFVPTRLRAVELIVDVEGFVQETRSFEPLKEGVDVDVGDVSMQLGTPVRLRFARSGAPLAGVEAHARQLERGAYRSGVSDGYGVVDLGTCETGVWQHDARTAHLGGQGSFEVPLQREPLVVNVELRDPPRERSISGQLVDTNDVAVAGAVLALPFPGGSWLPTKTEVDGHFLWSLDVPLPESVRERIELAGSQRDLEWVTGSREASWGTHDLRLVVRRRVSATLRLEVSDAATQQPLEVFGAICEATVGSSAAAVRRVAAEHHAGGVVTFELAPGDYYASVFAEPPFAESGENAVRLDEGRTTTLRVALRPAVELVVTCVDDATGAPIAGIDVALAKAVPAANARKAPSSWYQFFREQRMSTGSGGEAAVIVIARGLSDERGRIVMHAPADVPGLVLVAGGPRCVATEQHDVVLPVGGAETTLRVTAAAEVRGIVTPLPFVERFGPSAEQLAEVATQELTQWIEPSALGDLYPRIELRSVAAERTSELSTKLAADGSFVIGGVPAGRYEVWLEPVIAHVGNDIGPVAVVVVDPTKPLPALTIDVRHLVPARGVLRIVVDGAPARGSGGLARLVSDGVKRVSAALDERGTAVMPWLLPGTYVPFVEIGRALVYGEERIVVSSDGLVDATCALHVRRVALTVTDSKGAPMRDVSVAGEAIDRPELGATYWLRGRTDPDGKVTLDAVPSGRLRVRAFAPDRDLRLEREPALLLGDVAADTDAATFRLAR